MTARRNPNGRLVWLAAAACLGLALLLASAPPAYAADHWTDITDTQWIQSYGVTAAQASTVAQGYGDGSFHPTQTVSRAQYAKMVLAALGIPTASPPSPSFSDVPAESYYYPWIEGGVAADIISAQAGQAYRPGDLTTRQEASSPLAAFLAQKTLALAGGISGRLGMYPSLAAYFDAEGPALLAGFADRQDLSPDCAPGEAYLVFLGVIRGTGSSGSVMLSANAPLTRAQAVALILRTEGFLPKAAAPKVTAVAPAFGLVSGGAPVVISGSGFSHASSVRFGDVTLKASDFQVRSDSEVDVPAAPSGTGSVDVTVVNPSGRSTASGRDLYTYVSTLGPGDQVVQAALDHLGAPYVWGGAGPASFDCSGLVVAVYGELGIDLPHHAADQYPLGTPITSSDELQPGDLVFFGNPIYHVGIYVGDGNMIDATHTGSYVHLEGAGWSDYSGACRIVGAAAQSDPASAILRYEQNNPSLTYAGKWTTPATTSASGGTFSYANSSGTSVTFQFTGTEVVWIAKTSPVYGKARLILDGGNPVTVDLYSANVLWFQKVWDSGAHAYGKHTLRIEWTGKKSAAATDTNIDVDAFDVTGGR